VLAGSDGEPSLFRSEVQLLFWQFISLDTDALTAAGNVLFPWTITYVVAEVLSTQLGIELDDERFACS
jgi:hypothetical protein